MQSDELIRLGRETRFFNLTAIASLTYLRKEFHKYPELSGAEKSTAGRIAEELKKCEPDELIDGVGGNGVMAHFKAIRNRSEKTLLFRAELDAIAVQEQTGLPWQSRSNGKMHGCGHDGHMAILIGLARHLYKKRPENIDVLLLFQPAEETGEGAGRVLDDPRFRALHIDHAFALHNLPGFQNGAIVIKNGPFASASVGLEIAFKGASSHAAYPGQGVNPAQAVAETILQVGRVLNMVQHNDEEILNTTTFIRMGEPAFGISPGEARVGFTVRAATDQQLEKGVCKIVEVVRSVEGGFRGTMTHKKVEPFAATINSSEGFAVVKATAEQERIPVIELEKPFPWSEDFGEFRKKCPVTLFGLGAGEKSAPLHSEHYDFNDELIPVGVRMFSGIIESYGKP